MVGVEEQRRERVLVEGRGVGGGVGRRTYDFHCISLCGTGKQEGTIMGKLQAVNFYHEQWMGLLLPLGHFRVKLVRQGVARAGEVLSYLRLLRSSASFAEEGVPFMECIA